MIKKYNKLIRDNIPDIIKLDGKSCETRVLSLEEYRDALDAKLIEELKEYEDSKEIEELADIQEIIDFIVVAKGYTKEQFEAIRLKKEKDNGGFKKRLLLLSVDDHKK